MIRQTMLCYLGLLSFLLFTNAHFAAEHQSIVFTDPKLEQRYYNFIKEIRCVVCQNQSLIDSNADLASDLRYEIYQLMITGKQDQQIAEFLVSRYGDFVLYRPPLQKNTWLLWLAPFLFLVIAVITTVVVITRQAKPSAANNSDHRSNTEL